MSKTNVPIFNKTEGKTRIWLKFDLPDQYYRDPVLLLPPMQFSFEMYMEDSLIFDSGKMYPSGSNKFNIFYSHQVPLGNNYEGKSLLIAIYSQYDIRLNRNDNVFLTTGKHAFEVIFKMQLVDFIFGTLFCFAGLFSLLFFIKRFNARMDYALFFGIFSLSVGAMLIFTNAQDLFSRSSFEYYLAFIGFFSFPIGLFGFFEKLIKSPANWLIRRIWQLQIGFLVLALMLDIFNIVPMFRLVQAYYFMILCYLVVTVTVGGMAAVHGDREARLLFFGLLTIGLLGGYDILADLGAVMELGGLFKIGTFGFILFLIAILERRFAASAAKVSHYSEQLEEKSAALEVAKHLLENQSSNLERQIQERTRSLDEKNRMMQDTLDELKETQNQLVMREKMAALGNLVAGVAHEINTPIGAVNSAVQTVSTCLDRIIKLMEESEDIDSLRNNAKFQQYLELMESNNEVSVNAGKRIANIVKSLKNFARLDEAEFQKVDLHEGLDSTLTLVHHELKNHVKVEKDYQAKGLVPCFPNQLNQVFMNLFVNAAQAMENNGVLTIRTSEDKDWSVIEIEDTGKGMPESVRKRIFESGFTTKKRGFGTGLGLAICKNIIDKHAGTISVESEEGKGTIFTIRLPMENNPLMKSRLQDLT